MDEKTGDLNPFICGYVSRIIPFFAQRANEIGWIMILGAKPKIVFAEQIRSVIFGVRLRAHYFRIEYLKKFLSEQIPMFSFYS